MRRWAQAHDMRPVSNGFVVSVMRFVIEGDVYGHRNLLAITEFGAEPFASMLLES
jgi:hypothetical protein